MCGPPLPSRIFEIPPPLPPSEGKCRAPVRVVSGLPGRSRIYRLTQVLFTNADERIYLANKTDGKKQTLWLPLSRTPLKQKPAPEAPKEDKH